MWHASSEGVLLLRKSTGHVFNGRPIFAYVSLAILNYDERLRSL